MFKSKALDVLRAFETKDFRLFNDFINSPYYNKNEDLILFYEKLKKFAPQFQNKKLERTIFYKLCFPKKKYNEKHLGYLLSDLMYLLDEYLMVRLSEENKMNDYISLMNHYITLGLEKNYNSVLKSAEKLQKNYDYEDSQYYFYQYKIASTSNRYFELQNKRKFDQHIQVASDNFDLYFIAQKLKYACEIINRKSILSAQYELKLIDELVIYLKANPHDDIPAISIYYEILFMLLYPKNKRHFFKLNLLLHKHSEKFPPKESKDMYSFALNHCIKQINMGNTEYNRELFELYKVMISKEIIYHNGVLSPWLYKNVASVALRLKEYDWTKNFIETQCPKVDKNYRDSAYAYNLAYLHFSQGEYKEAMWRLHEVEFNDVFFHLDTKTMLLKIYFELKDIEPLLSLIDAFKVYLKRNKHISTYMKTSYRNLIKFVQKSLRLPDGDKDKWQALYEEIQNVKHVASTTWLLEKIKEKT